MLNDFQSNLYFLPNRQTIEWQECIEAISFWAGIPLTLTMTNWNQIEKVLAHIDSETATEID
jgi:hypothetical protein